METQSTLQIFTQINNILLRKKKLIFLCIVGVLLPVLLYNETTVPVYETGAKLIYEDAVPTLSNYSDDILRRYHREAFLTNRIEEIKSRSMAEAIAVKMIAKFPHHFDISESLPLDPEKMNKIIDLIVGSMDAYVVKNSDVIMINATTEDPQFSMDIVNTTSEVVIERNLKLKRGGVTGLREYIDEQVSIYRAQLGNSEQELKRFKETHKITSLKDESQQILARITDAEVRYNQIKAQRKSTEERLNVIRNKLSLNRERVVPTVTDVSSPSVQNLRQRLIDLQSQYVRLQVREYTDSDPTMIQLKAEIQETKKSLRAEALKVAQGGNIIDPLSQIQSYITQSLSLEIDLEALRAQEQALKNVVKEYDTLLLKLPAKELEFANLTRSQTVNEKIFMMLLEKREASRMSEAEKVANLRIIDGAQLPAFPTRPRKGFNLIIGMMVGLFLGFGLAFFLESMNTSLKTAEEVERLTSWPVLAVIPKVEFSTNGKFELSNRSHGKNSQPTNMAAEAFRVLRTNLQFLNSKDRFKSILVTSVSAGDGKSTVTTNLGITLTKLGLKVLIIDADLRRSKIHELLKIDKEPGLGNVLLNHHTIVNDLVAEELDREYDSKNDKSPVWSNIQNLKNHNKDVELLEENFKEFSDGGNSLSKEVEKPRMQYRNLLKISLIESIQATHIKNLKVLSSGKSVENPSEILSTRSVKLLIEEVSKKFDVVLIDSPPLLLVPDSMIMSPLVDGVLIVIESDKSEQRMVLDAQKFLIKTDSNVIGAVLNKIDLSLMYYKDKDYYYYS